MSVGPSAALDPRSLLATWANNNDEWVRFIVREILRTNMAFDDECVDSAYHLFRQEKALDERTRETEQLLEYERSADDDELPLAITELRDVQHVNAIVPGSTIEPHQGLTILYGENGTGKTGYSRIFKALAGSRTADTILDDIAADTDGPPSATIAYQLGVEKHVFKWSGENGHKPFTRMSIFDSPSVDIHVDDELEYVYVPAALALFNHVIAAIKAVEDRISADVRRLSTPAPKMLTHIPRQAKVYALIETLGASSDLVALAALKNDDPSGEETIKVLRTSVAALEANTIAPQISLRQRLGRVLAQSVTVARTLSDFDTDKYTATLDRRANLERDYRTFRDSLFAAADLPAEPEETWEQFVYSGGTYRQHLHNLGSLDERRCIYCRQSLTTEASSLIKKYQDYLDDKISADIRETTATINGLTADIRQVSASEVILYVDECAGHEESPVELEDLQSLTNMYRTLMEVVTQEKALRTDLLKEAEAVHRSLRARLETVTTELSELQMQADNRLKALAERKHELNELIAGVELARSWTLIEDHVINSKEADRLKALGSKLPTTRRQVTELAKTASQDLINQNFESLFAEECRALRARVSSWNLSGVKAEHKDGK